ncbi:MAG: hypothetical protein HQL93_13560, partial [Magnetococcales bacterium]|nr:hypothetical protein [Magnetococcales bacterium]
GSVAAGHLERDFVPQDLNFRNYLVYGLPIALLFLVVSTVYLLLIVPG